MVWFEQKWLCHFLCFLRGFVPITSRKKKKAEWKLSDQSLVWTWILFFWLKSGSFFPEKGKKNYFKVVWYFWGSGSNSSTVIKNSMNRQVSVHKVIARIIWKVSCCVLAQRPEVLNHVWLLAADCMTSELVNPIFLLLLSRLVYKMQCRWCAPFVESLIAECSTAADLPAGMLLISVTCLAW